MAARSSRSRPRQTDCSPRTVAERRRRRDALCAQDRAGDRAGGHGRLDHSGAAAPSAAVAFARIRRSRSISTRLRGKRVAVIGAGASAFDNAATALEAGAAEVHLFCRRAEIQVIQPYRWLTFRGFLAAFLRSGRCLALALHARRSRDAGRLSASDLRSLRAPCQFSSARRRADRSAKETERWRRIADAAGARSPPIS